jgi:hypothetical protein
VYEFSATARDNSGAIFESEPSTPIERPTTDPSPSSTSTGAIVIAKPPNTTPFQYSGYYYKSPTGSKTLFQVPADPNSGAAILPLTGLTPGATYATVVSGEDSNGDPMTLPSFENEWIQPTEAVVIDRPTVLPTATGPTTGTLKITKPPTGPIPSSYFVTCTQQGGTQDVISFTVAADAAGNASRDVTGVKPGTTYNVKAIGLGSDGAPVTLESLVVP